MLKIKEKVMRNILGIVLGVLAIGVCSAQMVTYLDAQGRPFMYSSKVGNQITYMDANGKPVAYQMSSSSSGPRIDPINSPSLVFPMISPSIPSAPTPPVLPPMPAFPELPTLKGF
jgi:hypothetical protein